MTLQVPAPIAITIRAGETLEQHLLELVQPDVGASPFPIGAAALVATVRRKHSAAVAGELLATWSTTNGKMAAQDAHTAGFAVSSADTLAVAAGTHELAIGIVTPAGAAHNLWVGVINVIAPGAALAGTVVPPVVGAQTWRVVVTLPVVPSFSVLPTTTGVPLLGGAPLGGTDGTVAGTPAPALTYQWQRESLASPGTWLDIAGATGATYAPVAADMGPRLRRNVIATNAAGAVTAVSSTTVQWTATSIAQLQYLYGNPGQLEGPLASIADLSPRARTLTATGTPGGSGEAGAYGARSESLRGQWTLNFNAQLSGKAEDAAGDARTAAQFLHRGGELFFAGVVGAIANNSLPIVGNYDNSSSAGNAARGITVNGITRKLELWQASDDGVSGGITHVSGATAFFSDVRPGDFVAGWWTEPNSVPAPFNWSCTLVRLPRLHLGESSAVVQTISGTIANTPSSGIAKKGFALGVNGAGGALFNSLRLWYAGAALNNGQSAADAASFLAAFQSLCGVQKRAPAVHSGLPVGGLNGWPHWGDAAQAQWAAAAATAEKAGIVRLAAARGEAIASVRACVLADSRGDGTGATNIATTGVRIQLHNQTFPYTRIADGWLDDLLGTPASKHGSISGVTVRSFAAIFGDSPYSTPDFANRLDHWIKPGAANGMNNLDVFHVFKLVNAIANGPFYWDQVHELRREIAYIVDMRQRFGDGKKQLFVLHTEPVDVNNDPNLSLERSESVGIYQLADTLERELGCICEVCDVNDYTYQP